MELEELARVMAAVRPRVHRYCARMVGSAFDGEDIVQDAFARAAEAWPVAGDIANPEGWLLRIAHNVALDALRRRRRQGEGSITDLAEPADDTAHADARVAAAASLSTFLHLPTLQRSSVVLVDVLGHSAAETAAILGVSVAGVKAALHRARLRLRELSAASDTTPRLAEADRARLCAYADRFNARDFDALRDLLSEEVRLELVNRVRLAGRKDVSVYFTRYALGSDWRWSVGWAEGRAVLLVDDPTIAPDGYVVLLDWVGGRIAAIRDFRFAPYVMDGLAVERF